MSRIGSLQGAPRSLFASGKEPMRDRYSSLPRIAGGNGFCIDTNVDTNADLLTGLRRDTPRRRHRTRCITRF